MKTPIYMRINPRLLREVEVIRKKLLPPEDRTRFFERAVGERVSWLKRKFKKENQTL